MKPSEKPQDKGSSYIGMFFSVALHVGIVLFFVFWGVGEAQKLTSDGVIQVSLSGFDEGGGNVRPKSAPPKIKKPAPIKPKEEIVKKEEVIPPPEEKEPPKEEKKEVKEVEKKPEPEKKEEPKEVVKEEIKKKDIVPLETEKEKKEPEKKVKATPKPKPKPKPTKEVAKKTEKKPSAQEARKDYLAKMKQDREKKKRDEVLERLKKDEVTETEEKFGEERKLAMADDTKTTMESESEAETGSGGGNSISKSGTGSAASPAILRAYSNRLSSEIRHKWIIPPSVPTDGSLRALIFFKIDDKGNVYDVWVKESSGNPSFDSFCVSAVNKAAPLTPPPSEFAKEAKSAGLEVPFRNDP